MNTAPAEVTVLEAKTLTRWLRRKDAILSVPTLGHVYAAARREDTWTEPRA